ncbi:IS21 family transposase [Streptomyces sp. HNM0645]|uniref:IS21 family transposase n=1 Tax=Streptomyces sp. HNM0645 TaxID=2782343 RepID=UPI0024B7880B|nr:IS21 family transposase [Streptomyces sp. HNM0645]MDI9889238.1 IS21 family transposase [Streptomyces sp. HNM0645]
MDGPRTKVELFAAIRRDARVEKLSIRELSRRYGVHRRLVREALTSPWPTARKPMPPRASVLDPYKHLIDSILRADLDAPRKQRHTAKRVFDRLVDEHSMEDVSYGRVRDYIRRRKPEIWVEEGRGPPAVFIPQTHRPGEEAEVDFGDVYITLNGVRTLCYLFVFRLSFSGKAVHRIFLSQGQEAFFEGHLHAFEVLGGVPRGKVRYDNLTSAVARVLGFTRARVETDRWTAFRSWAGLEVFYCAPGIDGAHEKGGVEGEVGRFRRNHLVPVPDVTSLAELNAQIDAWDRQDDQRRIGERPRTVGEYFAIEKPLLQPLPEDHFETGRLLTPRVDRYAQITVRMNHYSVPVRLIGRQVRVLLHASELMVYDGRTEVARHERLATRGGSRLDLDHYLEGLLRKPGALPGATALDQARAAGKFTPVHDAWWEATRRAHGDAAGTRALIEVLLLHRHMSHDHVVAGTAAALRAGALTSDAVALEARRAAERDTPGEADPQATPGRIASPVVSLAARRLAALPPDSRPLPSVAAYDQLLRHTRPPAERPTS